MRNTALLTSLILLPATACGDEQDGGGLNSTSITASGGNQGDSDTDAGDDSGGSSSAGGGTDGGLTTGGGDPTTGGDPTGGNTTTAGGQGGPCGCGFPEWACEPDFHENEGTEGPMPPLCGGGSGLSDDPPNECFGGNFGTGSYSDAASFCDYFIARFRYLENECGNFNTVNLALDPSLGAIAQAEADAVADGKDPSGEVTCGGSPCGPLDGPAFNLGGGAAWLYIDGWTPEGAIKKDSMFTAPETDMIIQSNPLWSDQNGNPLYERACQYTTEFSNAIVYHYCNWDGVGEYGNPATQPARVGCGVAVDTDGITWRVVKLGD